MSEHTPGQWDMWHDGCDSWHIQAAAPGGEPGDLMTLCDNIIGEPNARIISAAPDMLAALVAIRREAMLPIRLWNQVFAAMSKATGKDERLEGGDS